MSDEFYESPILLSGVATPSYNVMIRSWFNLSRDSYTVGDLTFITLSYFIIK
jgi:hypothetical protein